MVLLRFLMSESDSASLATQSCSVSLHAAGGVGGRAVTRTRCSEAPVSHGALTLADPQHPAAEAAHQQAAGNPQQVSLAHFSLKILPLC